MVEVANQIIGKAGDKAKRHSSIKNSCEILTNQNENVRGKRVPLPDPLRRMKPNRWVPIDNNGKRGSFKTSSDISNPCARKVHFNKGSQNGVPIEGIISLLIRVAKMV